MALATTLFVATDEDLARLFVAVRMPLDAPITKVGRNLHTGQIMGSRSWDPGTTDERSGGRLARIRPRVAATRSTVLERDEAFVREALRFGLP